MTSPYENFPPAAFWRTGVAGQAPQSIPGLYSKKFPIGRGTRIATAGSCFAQHIGRQLRANGFSVIDEEPPPPGLDASTAQRFGFGLYSARYGNIYTARQLRQLAEEASRLFEPVDVVWIKGERYFDSLRPSVEPGGLSSPEAVLDHRAWHLECVRRVIRRANIFVFTLGLTEAWIHSASGTVYPTAPGVVAGTFDPSIHQFHNFTFQEIYEDLTRFFDLAKSENPDIRFLLTVSPVPLTATASGEHVLRATVYSKSVLRAVAGQLFHERSDVEYVPSYEVVTSPVSKSGFFEDNLRTVRPSGVEAAMNMFFAEHGAVLSRVKGHRGNSRAVEERSTLQEDVECEEALLEAFGP